jgi:hypothetical protein
MIEIPDLSSIEANGILDGPKIALFLIENKRTKKEPVTVFNLNISPAVVKAIRLVAKNYIQELLDITQEIQEEKGLGKEVDLIPEYNPDHSQAIFQIQKDTIDAPYFDSLASFLSGEHPPVPFEKEKVKENLLKAWVIRFEYIVDDTIKHIHFFQKFQASNLLSAKKISFFQVGGEFVLLEDTIFAMNDTIDFLLHENTFVVTKMVAFEKLFGYEAFYKEKATDMVTTLYENQVPGLDYQVVFPNLPQIKENIQKSTRIAHKLYSANKNGYFKEISFASLEDLNGRHKLDLKLDAASKKWEVDGDANLMTIAQVLNDDYGKSQLTTYEYLSFSKEKI